MGGCLVTHSLGGTPGKKGSCGMGMKCGQNHEGAPGSMGRACNGKECSPKMSPQHCILQTAANNDIKTSLSWCLLKAARAVRDRDRPFISISPMIMSTCDVGPEKSVQGMALKVPQCGAWTSDDSWSLAMGEQRPAAKPQHRTKGKPSTAAKVRRSKAR